MIPPVSASQSIRPLPAAGFPLPSLSWATPCYGKGAMIIQQGQTGSERELRLRFTPRHQHQSIFQCFCTAGVSLSFAVPSGQAWPSAGPQFPRAPVLFVHSGHGGIHPPNRPPRKTAKTHAVSLRSTLALFRHGFCCGSRKSGIGLGVRGSILCRGYAILR